MHCGLGPAQLPVQFCFKFVFVILLKQKLSNINNFLHKGPIELILFALGPHLNALFFHQVSHFSLTHRIIGALNSVV